MKVFIVIAILIALTATQTVVTPKTQGCACTNLLNQADCQALSGCTWTPANSTSATITTVGTCANLTTTTTIPIITAPAPTYCGSVLNSTSACAQTFGCAYQNSTCQIFTGCSAYVQTTNAACQAISTQCTTDATRCVLPGTCLTYTTQALCQGNIATSGAKQCKWTAVTGTAGTCGDMICSDASTSLNTLALCQAWISNCFSTGKGCVASLGLCSSYTIVAGCTGMIGSDGGCIANTASGSTACRPIACTDAPIATSTTAACGLFLSGCVTTGKGCITTLSSCSTYAQSLGCSGLLGNDGFCTTDTTTGAVNCRALLCTDAPASTNTDAACIIFKAGCQTTGQGCVTIRGACSSYTGTTTSCVSYIGTDGNCKGTSATTAVCAAKQCTDAPTTSNTDSTCSAFQTGCVTTGLGCIASLGACSSYQGTASTCPQYKGNDGNCTAPSTQLVAASCIVKVCADAGNQSTNSGCQQFSYKCVTNGTICILPGSCETIGTTVSCQGTSTCNSGSQCLNRSTCVSYTTQSLCLLNQQQYVPALSTTTYPRACTWGATCTNKICTDLAATLITDLTCSAQLAGCVTTNAGCVDIGAACSAYSGITATCSIFKGINGTKVCTQLTSQGSPAACIDRNCANASTGSSVTQNSDATCSTYLSTCFFNKNVGCTDGGCTSYFGTQAVCSAITTALNGLVSQKCWQLIAVVGTTTACTVKVCSDSPNTNNTDALCAAFLTGCVTNGTGCVPNTNVCSQYTGNLTQCSLYNQNVVQQCSKTSQLCRLKLCTDTVANPSAANCTAYLSTCAFNGTGCAVAAACTSYALTTFALCNATTDGAGNACGWATAGAACKVKACTDALTTPNAASCTAYISTCAYNGTICAVAAACSTYALNTFLLCNATTDGAGNACGWASGGTACKAKACTDAIPNQSTANCSAYLSTCQFNGISCFAVNTCTSFAMATFALCNAATDGSVSSCSWTTARTACKAKQCIDPVPSPAAASCTAYMSTCAYNGTACAIAAACSTYALSSFATCNLTTDGYGNSCGWATGASACKAKACTDAITSPAAASCTAYISNCAFNGTACAAAASCTSYALNTFALCNATTDGAGNACGWFTGGTACKVKGCTDIVPSPSAATCTAYLSTCAYNGTACISAALCTSYALTTYATCTATSDGAGNVCGYQGIACRAKVCTDAVPSPSAATCTAYLSSCAFNGTACAAAAACPTYALATFALCNATTDGAGHTCGWATGGAACKVKGCTDPVPTPAAASCTAYLSTCAFNGTSCAAAAACTTYALATFALCNATTDGAGNACGWVSGANCKAKGCTDPVPSPAAASCTAYLSTCAYNGTACAAAAACTTYALATFALCTATTDGAGNACGWVSGANCKAKGCTDPVPTPAAASCTAYLSTCAFDGTVCAAAAACTTYALATFALCNATTDGAGNACGWVSGANCKAKGCTDPVPSPAAASCTAYLSTCAYNGSACAAAAACPTYALATFALCNATTDGAGNACGWVSGANCKVKGCTDPVPAPAAASCTAYLSTCAYNGTACAAAAACTTYAINTYASCILTTDGAGNACGWATGGVACKARACTDAIPSPAAATCTAYLSTCAYNGTTCVAATACSTYALTTFALCNATTDGAGNACGLFPGGTSCKSRACTDVIPSPAAATCTAYLSTCAYNGIACATAASCTSYALNTFALCNATTDGAGNACGWFTGGVTCKVKGCTDIVPSPSAATCTAYISSCAYNGTACAAAAACPTYALATFALCNATTDGAGNSCGWVSGANCKVKGCTDPVPAPAAASCTAYLSTCAYNGTACAAAAACSTYVLNTFALCNLTTDGAGNACGWVTGGTACKAKACTDTLTTPSAANCVAYLSSCGFNGTTCYSGLLCSSYAYNNFSQCNGVLDGAGNTCGWATGGTSCKAKACTDAIPTQNAANCTAYLSSCGFNGLACVVQTACTSYNISTYSSCILTTDGSGGSCGWTTSGTTCKSRVCTDAVPSPNAATCTAYLSTCAFNGTACVVPTACTSYAQTSASACNVLTDGAGNSCGWITAAVACKAKACTDVISSPSAVNCNAYLTGCLFNGTNCVVAGNCNLYVAQGATDSIKSSNCNALTGPTTATKCTFVVGQTNCQDTAACSTFAQTSLVNCLLSRDTAGLYCGFLVGDATCSSKACPQQLLESSCNDTWITGCIINTTSGCASKACNLALSTSTTNTLCSSYRSGCVTNSAGCLESTANCGIYTGTQVTCQTMTGADGPCNNVVAAVAATACFVKTCIANTVATSDSACATWYPPTGSVKNCIWNGTTGCIAASTLCSGFTGTIDSCATYSASDSPCSGVGSTVAACVSNSLACSKAPSSYSTHALCQTWNTGCMTNGFGCISTTGATCMMISSPTVCPLYKTVLSLGCDISNQCLTRPSLCGGFVNAFDCNNIPIAGAATVNCAWNTQTNPATCITLTCGLLPVTLTSDSACSGQISTCTTNSAGCVTKGACSSYNKLACGPATTTDTQKVCIWANSTCRTIVCSDNTSSTSDSVCNTYLTGCRTTGLGCSSSLTCSQFTSALYCQKDQNNNPCLWNRGACINYTKCTDVTSSSHAICQAVSPLCTTNGTTCFPITGCSVTTLLASCILGTDGNCGWLPASGAVVAACALYTSCTLAQGTSTSQCLLWGSTCVSNGVSCITKSTCSSYVTQIACGNAGTDGTCFYVVPTGTATVGTCRLQLCSDATSATATSITTHTGCVAFAATTSCTTSGTGCISWSSCGSYGVSAGCVQGTDGVCFWATTTVLATATTLASSSSLCRLKQCPDSLLTSSSSCQTAISGVKCVSNGINCIPQSTCSTYTAREACLGSGSDGQCAFTPGANVTTPNVGTCGQFTSCASSNSDSVTCGTRTDACFFNSSTTNGTTTLSCSSHTCATKALGSICQAIPSFDLSTYSICVLTGTTCAAGNPTSFTAAQCYGNSVRTYTWNPSASACQSCATAVINTTIPTNTTTTSGDLIRFLIAMSFII